MTLMRHSNNIASCSTVITLHSSVSCVLMQMCDALNNSWLWSSLKYAKGHNSKMLFASWVKLGLFAKKCKRGSCWGGVTSKNIILILLCLGFNSAVEAIAYLTCHRGKKADGENPGRLDTWLHLASSWIPPNALTDRFSMAASLRA